MSSAELAKKNRTVKLSSGYEMPVFALGTWKSNPGEVTAAVMAAIDAGYRHIDCAYCYENEDEVGAALKAKINDGTIKREDIFITSKLWATFMDPKHVEEGFQRSLKALGLDYLDLYLIHSPMSSPYHETAVFQFGESNLCLMTDTNPVDTWKEMEKLVQKGLTRSIGVSNFNSQQIEDILKVATVPVAVSQIERHPGLDQTELINFCKSKNIHVTAYSPIGSPDRSFATAKDLNLREDATIKEVANAKGCTPVQVLLAYHLCQDLSVIAKSVNAKRIQDNFKAYDVKLTEADIKKIDSLQCNYRAVPWQFFVGHKYFPFSDLGIAYS